MGRIAIALCTAVHAATAAAQPEPQTTGNDPADAAADPTATSPAEDEGGPVPSVEPPTAAWREWSAETDATHGARRTAHSDDDASGAASAGDVAERPAGLAGPLWLESQAEDAALIEVGRGGFTFAPQGMIQIAGVPWLGDGARLATGSQADQPGFRFRRARLGAEGAMPLDVKWEMLAEFDSGGARLLDANLRVRLPIVELTAGVAKVPFSASALTPAAFLSFLDRPWAVDGRSDDGAVYGIAPGRMLGFQAAASWNMLRFSAGAFNGNREYFIGDDNAGLLYAARVECHPLGDLPDGQLRAGGGVPLLRLGASYLFNDDAAGDRHAAGGDVKLRAGPLTVEGEFLWSRFIPDSAPRMPGGEPAEVDRIGYYAQVAVLLPGDLVEIAARHDGFLLKDGVGDFNDRWGVAGSASLLLLGNRLKAQVEYVHRHQWYEPQVSDDHVALQVQGRF